MLGKGGQYSWNNQAPKNSEQCQKPPSKQPIWWNYFGPLEVKPMSAEALAEANADRPIAEGPRKTVWIYNLPLYWIQTLSEKVLSPLNYATNTSYGSIGLMKSLFSRKLKSPIIRKSPRKQNQLAVQSSAELKLWSRKKRGRPRVTQIGLEENYIRVVATATAQICKETKSVNEYMYIFFFLFICLYRCREIGNHGTRGYGNFPSFLLNFHSFWQRP